MTPFIGPRALAERTPGLFVQVRRIPLLRLLLPITVGKHHQIVWPDLADGSTVPPTVYDARPAEHLVGIPVSVITKPNVVDGSWNHLLRSLLMSAYGVRSSSASKIPSPGPIASQVSGQFGPIAFLTICQSSLPCSR